MTPFLQGFATGFSLILAIGAQNAFVLRQGIRREHVAAVVAICALSDAVLIAAGVAGFGTVTLALPWLWLRADADGVRPSVGRFLWRHRIKGFELAACRFGRLRLYVVTCKFDDRTVVLRATASRHWWRAAAHRYRLQRWLAAVTPHPDAAGDRVR